jgi:two-component system, LytTR family, response regulator
MLTAIIADDETLARRRIRALLRPHADVEIVEECRDGATTIAAVRARRPALLFLDIEMPEVDGFGVLSAVDAVPAVIFVTAHQNYAVDAFRANVLDYLLKPFRRSRFDEALSRARQRIGELEGLRKLQTPAIEHNAITIKTDSCTLVVDHVDIECVVAERDYVHVFTDAGEYLVREGLASILSRLGERFVRIHRSTGINIDAVRQINALRAGDAELTLRSGRQVTLSRTHRPAFAVAMQNAGRPIGRSTDLTVGNK